MIVMFDADAHAELYPSPCDGGEPPVYVVTDFAVALNHPRPDDVIFQYAPPVSSGQDGVMIVLFVSVRFKRTLPTSVPTTAPFGPYVQLAKYVSGLFADRNVECPGAT